MRRWLILLVIAISAARSGAQPSCQPDAVLKAAAIAHQQQVDLLRVRVEEMTTEVSPALQGRIRGLKDGLASTVEAGMSCAPAGETADGLQFRLANLLGANTPEGHVSEHTVTPPVGKDGFATEDRVYGDHMKLSVASPSNAAGMRAVTVAFSIECGVDSMLFVYKQTPGGWKRLLRWQSGDYKDISGAFGDLFLYAILPGGDAQTTSIVVAHGTDWCTSRFSGFKLDLLGPAPGGTATVLWHTQRDYSRDDTVARLRAADDGFELRVNAPALDLNAYERAVIYHYRVAGNRVIRTGPIATTGRGFVEEWLAMPWDEAKEVTAPEAISGTKPLHERKASLNQEAKTYVSYTYGPVRSCLAKGTYQVQMNAEPGGSEFYTIMETAKGYVMANISASADERCSGSIVMR